MQTEVEHEHEGRGEDPPPVLSSWPRLYAVVLGELAVVVALLYALGRWAS